LANLRIAERDHFIEGRQGQDSLDILGKRVGIKRIMKGLAKIPLPVVRPAISISSQSFPLRKEFFNSVWMLFSNAERLCVENGYDGDQRRWESSGSSQSRGDRNRSFGTTSGLELRWMLVDLSII
jgi:hypothetical protein